jgi:hypothetical protein
LRDIGGKRQTCQLKRLNIPGVIGDVGPVIIRGKSALKKPATIHLFFRNIHPVDQPPGQQEKLRILLVADAVR